MTTAPKPDAVTLTDAEQALYAKLADLDANEHGARLAALQAAADLTRSLRDRNAIPQVRVLWFTDPAHNIGGRGKSRLQVFEGNGTRGAAILSHPHFVKHLRYFIEGPALPPAVIGAFGAGVADCGTITSGDTKPLCDLARKLARQHGARDHEEFFKLALECGLDLGLAEAIRKAVQQIK